MSFIVFTTCTARDHISNIGLHILIVTAPILHNSYRTQLTSIKLPKLTRATRAFPVSAPTTSGSSRKTSSIAIHETQASPRSLSSFNSTPNTPLIQFLFQLIQLIQQCPPYTLIPNQALRRPTPCPLNTQTIKHLLMPSPPNPHRPTSHMHHILISPPAPPIQFKRHFSDRSLRLSLHLHNRKVGRMPCLSICERNV
ncbi:hypothetical protein K491DRAFT_267458 [Lophiostoma macrostomum CBS 122681]|uniref:Uncharacterized protein n=1 Tax=Lophiostoma macrostomum CBS 122681 TaxID=1314788 RepID=A0A6A6TEW0_9PLEO|nr:hypothetical protein K491DRAFT_267458 [Lophiostoma macrostomum CBS 122681]